jgi:hypothetical protein
MTVSARADAPPMLAAPIAEVVPAARGVAGRPVAHLVRRVTSGAEPLIGDQVFVGKIILIGRWKLTAPDPSRQPGTLLHDQCIRADVRRRGRKRRVQT